MSVVLFIGDDALLNLTFEDFTSGALLDPATITITVTSPASVVTTLTIGSGITRISAGVYQGVVNVTESGLWTYDIISTAPAKAGRPGSFFVTADNDA